MFVSNQQLRTQSETTFFNDKALPTGNISERDDTPVQDCWFNPKGNAAYKYFFLMNQEKEFVTGAKSVQVTPAQKALLDLLDRHNVGEFNYQLTVVLELATYFVDDDLVNRKASYTTLQLSHALADLAAEFIASSNLKNQNS